MRLLPANIAGVMIWRRSYRFPHLPFQVALELLVLHVVEEKNAAIHLPAQLEIFAGEINKGGESINVRRF
jgi:hypothetical protein